MRVWSFEVWLYGVRGLRFGVRGSRFEGFGFRILGLGFWVSGLGLKVQISAQATGVPLRESILPLPSEERTPLKVSKTLT